MNEKVPVDEPQDLNSKPLYFPGLQATVFVYKFHDLYIRYMYTSTYIYISHCDGTLLSL